jgi:mRNA interferase MazF
MNPDMRTFRQGDIVRVPFPYTDRNTRQHRPALVVSDGPVGDDHTLLWVAMITSATHRPWPGDHPIEAFAEAGLPIPSVVRSAKITTIEARNADGVGRLDSDVLSRVMTTIATTLGR